MSGLGERFEKELLDLVYRKYVLKMRRDYINKRIKEKNKDKYKVRREISKELSELKQQLLIEKDPRNINEIQNRIAQLQWRLDEINQEISNNAKIEFEIKEFLNNEIKNCEKRLKNIIKGLIDKERDIEVPVKEAIKNNEPALASIVVLDEGEKPERVNSGKVVLVEASVPGKGG